MKHPPIHRAPRPVRERGAVRTATLLAACALAVVVTASTAMAEVRDGGAESCRHGKMERAAARAYDESSGRDLRRFPPDRIVDHLHMKLEMRFDDIESRRFKAVETLRIAPIGAPTESLRLDAVGLDVLSVRGASGPIEHYADDDGLTLRFDPPLAVGIATEVVFEYRCEDPADGMVFTPSSAALPDYTAEVHTQGQEIGNRHWFIAHDAPNERMTTELIVDVPAEYAVSSNGRLVSTLVTGDRAVWHWLQDKPHVSYLVSLVIGKFDLVEIPHERVPMQVWVPRGLGHQVMQTYGRTGAMIDLFETRFGVPYPWARYDQLVLKNFAAGGMENTSATSMYATAILDETALLDGDLDGLISHELAHQWTGDLLTCKDWAHIWLNEGFATYGEALWFEHRDGEDGYLDAIRGDMRVARRDRTTGDVAMVCSIYDDPGENFWRPGNPYPKGSSILHMLRRMLGDDVFFAGVRLYTGRHANGCVETDDLRYAMEEVSGRGLEWFFDQWCYRPGCPELKVIVDYDGGARDLLLTVEQAQKIDDRTPAFRFTLPVHVRTERGDRIFAIDVRERLTTFRAALPAAPLTVSVDPWLHVLGTVEVEKPSAMWVRQVAGGPTVVARHRAVEALGRTDTAEHRTLLVALVRDRTAHRSLRRQAVDALSSFGSDEAESAIVMLLEDGVDDARVRADLVRALPDAEDDAVETLLAEIARGDPSYANRAAAIDGLARIKAVDRADLIADLVRFESQHDQVRSAALEALADLDDSRGLDLALDYAAYGHADRSRPAAIRVVGRLAGHDRDRAVEALIEFLDDPAPRAASAAGRALVEIGDERAIPALEAMARSDPNPSRRERAEQWLERLRSGDDGNGPGAGRGRRRGGA